MNLFQLPNWPLLFICLGMIVCAVIDWWKFKVPNVLTYPLILSGWLLGLLHTFGVYPDGSGALPSGGGGIGSALAGTFFGLMLLLPVYAINGMGAGDVKMCAGFGSWVGAFYGLDGGALWICFFSFAAGVIIGGVISLVMIVIRGDYRKNLENSRAIVMDLLTSGSLSKITTRAEERKKTRQKLPYGVPLCIGFVGLLFWIYQPKSEPVSPEQPQEQATNGAQM